MNEPMKITREELYERIWKVPATKLAKELGISDVALTKICRKLNVPKPGPGHWRLVQLGWEMQRPPLPASEEDARTEATIDPEPHRTRKVEKKPAAPPEPAATEVVFGPSEAAEHGVLDMIRQATRTDFTLRVVGWHHYSSEHTRILVKKREADLDRIVRAVQVLGLSRNRVLDGDKVRETIQGLVGQT